MEKEKKEHLTNEKISNKFKSQFELVNYAIKLADNLIRSGREARIETNTQNPALQVLEEIEIGTDKLEDLSFDHKEVIEHIDLRLAGKDASRMGERRRGRF